MASRFEWRATAALTPANAYSSSRRESQPAAGTLNENSTSVIVPPDWSGHLSSNGKVGQGVFGKVFDMTVACSDMHVAVKAIHRDTGAYEAGLLEQFSSGRVLKVLAHGFSYDDQWKEVEEWGYCIMTEFADGGHLGVFMASNAQSVPFQKKIELVAEVFEGLAFLHGMGVVHNDIKPDNILLFSGAGGLQAKLADVGLSCAVGGSNEAIAGCRRMKQGGPAYMSPEHLLTHTVDLPKDIWAAGIIAYYLIFDFFGRRPCVYAVEELASAHSMNVSKSGTGWEVQNREFKFDFSISAAPSKYWKTLQTLLAGVLKFDPGKRLTAQQALDLCMQVLDKALPDPKIAELPACWKRRVINKEAQLVTATENGHPISADLASNVHVNARGVALKNAVAWGHVESIKLLVDHEISDEAMAGVVAFALAITVDRGAQYLDSILPALRVRMAANMVHNSLRGMIKGCGKVPYLFKTVVWLLQASLLSDSAKVDFLKESTQCNFEETACVLVESMEDDQLRDLFTELYGSVSQGRAGIVHCLLRRISRFAEPTDLREAINKQAKVASKKGRTFAEDSYSRGEDRFGTFAMLVNFGISDDVASDILLWYVCHEEKDLARIDARFISKTVDRLAGKIDILSKALTGANERGHTDLARQLVDAGALAESNAEEVCKPKAAPPRRRPLPSFPLGLKKGLKKRLHRKLNKKHT